MIISIFNVVYKFLMNNLIFNINIIILGGTKQQLRKIRKIKVIKMLKMLKEYQRNDR